MTDSRKRKIPFALRWGGGQEDNQEKIPLNDETTFEDRDCQLEVAEVNRSRSNSRDDVHQTTDGKAFDDMYKYLESNTTILDKHKESEVAAFYSQRSILITGATGFVGKCLLEKLLRSCPELKQVFILLRPKRGVEVGERVENLLKSELFNRLKDSEHGQEQLDKIVAIKGDITKPLFGLSKHDIELLTSKVSVIFHSAATVKFVEPLKIAIQNNVVSVENLIDLASRFQKLEAMVHVSTAYSNCDRKQVEEIFYEAPIKADKLIDMADWIEPETFEKLSPILLGARPNTYTYTKAVAESLLVERSKKLLPNVPIAMVRPSIVGGIWRQPISGWVDNFNGPTGVILSMMTGAIQAMHGCPYYCADIVPVDVVANLLICTAWQIHKQNKEFIKCAEVGETREQNNNITVFNCVSGTLNPVAWSDFSKYIKQIGLVYPCSNLLRRPGTLLISNQFMFEIFYFINHTTVAYIGDFFMKLAGQKPKLVMIHERMVKMISTLKPFTTNQWSFKCSNVTSLYEKMTTIDKEIFNFDIRQVKWDDYLRRYYVGSKLFALRDNPEDVVKARHKLRRMRIGSQLIQTLFLIFLYYVLLSGTSIEQYAVENISQTISRLLYLTE